MTGRLHLGKKDGDNMQKIHNIEQIPYGMLYLPLKGIIMNDYYPSVGMRQMSDNDILFDADAWERMEKHMISEGYKAEYVGKGHDERWVEYYSDIKDRLIPDRTDDRCYGYHMSDEDFYIYITSHAYKHYSGSGTGLRTLMDFYAYLNAKGDTFNLDYIWTECKKHRDYMLRRLWRKWRHRNTMQSCRT